VPTASRYSSKRLSRPRPRAAAPAGGLDAALRELLALGDSAGWVVSCYQKLEPGDRAGEKYRIKLKNRLRRAADRLSILGFSHAERETVAAALSRIEEFFRYPSNLSGSRGIAVFAGRGSFRAVRLPHVLRSRVLVDRTPVVGELVALAEAGSRVLVVAVDRKSARLFDAGLDRVEELEGIVAPDATRPGRYHPNRGTLPGVGEFRFHNRIRQEKHRHLSHVADAVTARLKGAAFDGLLIGGIGADPEALRRHLHPSITDRRAVGVVSLNPKQVTASEVRERVAEFLGDRARSRAEREVDAFRGALGTGWATNGVEATLRALARGQVSTLLVDHDAEVPGFRFSESGRLSEDDASGRGEGEPVPVADVLDDAIEDALRQRSRVAVVRGSPARSFERLGGILRFKGAAR
jgi:peptide chain release factor subunit 1